MCCLNTWVGYVYGFLEVFIFYFYIVIFLSLTLSVDVIIFYWISYNILLYLFMRAILLILLAVSLSNAYLINDTKATDTKNSTKPRRRSTTPYLAGSYEVA